MGWWVDPWFARGSSNLESHRNQSRIVCHIIAYAKLLVVRQVRDRLSGHQRDRRFRLSYVYHDQDRSFDSGARGESGQSTRTLRGVVCEDGEEKEVKTLISFV